MLEIPIYTLQNTVGTSRPRLFFLRLGRLANSDFRHCEPKLFWYSRI